MEHRDLRGAIAAIVAATLAGCDVFGEDGWPVEGEGWELPTCTGGAWTPLADLTLAVELDGLELVAGGVQTPPEAQDVLGDPCGGATDEPACDAALAAAEQDGAGLVGTAGDTVERWVGADGALELLGAIDHPSEAMVLAWASGDDVVCGDLDQGAMRASPEGGYDVVTSHYTSTCKPVERVRTLRHVDDDGRVTVVDEDVVSRDTNVCIGRRPAGLAVAPAGRGIGAWLARTAALEAASVDAFEHLARELAALGAPPELVDRARAAADDERRHAVAMGRLAGRYGADAPAPEVAPTPLRDLLALALDNTVEGCVREAWGAVVGAWQARTAADPVVAATMGPIAADEAAHAELSFAIAAWAEARLGDADRARIAEARTAAIRELRGELRAARGFEPALGLPAGPLGESLFEAFARVAWA